MARLDIQGDLRERLAASLGGTEVRTSVPDERPAELVVVRREGGAAGPGILDAPGIGIDCWAPTEAEAYRLCELACAAVESLPFGAGYCLARQESMRSDYDVAARSPRWYASYSVITYKY